MRLAACIEYEGSGFSGWQSQKDQSVRFVQAELEAALSKVADCPVTVVCAGRTDTGVHATAQIVHFDTEAIRSQRSWVLGSNVNLPDDISVVWVQEVDSQFHARFSAISRAYRYIIDNRWTRPAILRNRVTWERNPLDIELMRAGAAHLIGKHDFTSYRSLACQAKNPVRDLRRLDVSRQGDFVVIDVEANAFLHHMVRNLAGVLIAIGRGEEETSWSRQVLDARDRALGGVTAPSAGLYLVEVGYPAEHILPVTPPLPSYA
jgi:tRNA pseudouridine38-40 synthase